MAVLDLRVVVTRLQPELRQSLERAVSRAVTRSHATVDVEHWLLELLENNRTLASYLGSMEISLDRVVRELSARINLIRTDHEGSPALSRLLLQWIEEAWMTASLRFGRNDVAPADLIAALTTSSTLNRLISDIAPSLRLKESMALALAEAVPASVSGEAHTSGSATWTNKDTGDLDRYTLDLTAEARAGRLDPVIGREAELRQVLDILMRRRQNNPILTGEAGVGKTAIVEALALRIAERNVPDKLTSVAIHALDLALLQAGAGIKGEFERRLTGVISEIKAAATPIILFVDEAHLLIGAGNQVGGNDAANLLKPALARGELRTIAATTWSEYKRHIERDPALTRRFQVVKVDEPSPETAVRILRGIAPNLEKHHGVRIMDEALSEAVRLSARYLPDRQLPDKALGVLDTAAARVAISRTATPAAIEDIVAEAEHLRLERAAICRDEPPNMKDELGAIDARVAEIQSRHDALAVHCIHERELIKALEEGATSVATTGDDGTLDNCDERIARRRALERDLASRQGDAPLVHHRVDSAAVAAVISRWTGIPTGRLQRDSIHAVVTLEARLRERVIGQNDAVATIAAAMKTSAAKVTDPRKPQGVFLLVGPSGVGKTETALALADELFGGRQHLTIVNMTEFKEEHKISSLTGSPPGYVGYGEGGVLTEAVRRRPYGLLLLDEIEKAHPGVQDVFYQVFDKGMLRDSEGRDISFLNTTIILTSNVGSETLAALSAGSDPLPQGDALIEALRPELAKHFKPAFLGRVMVAPYLPLPDSTLLKIVELQMARIHDRLLQAHNIKLHFAESVKHEIVKRCLALDIGARAIEGVFSHEVLPLISDIVLNHALQGTPVGSIEILLDPAHTFAAHVDTNVSAPSEKPAERHRLYSRN